MSEVLHSHFIDGAHNVLIIIKVKLGNVTILDYGIY